MDSFVLSSRRRDIPTLLGLMLLAALGGCKGSTSNTGNTGNTTRPANLRAVSCSSSQCVAVGDSQTIATSSDGINWALHLQPGVADTVFGGTDPYSLRGVATSPSKWVAVGQGANDQLPYPALFGIVLTSPDGATWTPVTGRTVTTSAQYGVIWNGSQFATAGYEQEGGGLDVFAIGGTIYSSSDGLKWTSATAPGTAVTFGSLNGIAWSGKTYVAVGDASALATSPDGLNWTVRTSPETQAEYNAVTWSGTGFVVVGSGGSGAVIDTSPDGVTWSSVDGSGISELEGIAWSGKSFVAVGSGGIYSSLDGVSWTHQQAPIGTGLALHGVTFGRSEFLAVGDTGTILTSLDGITWTKRAGP